MILFSRIISPSERVQVLYAFFTMHGMAKQGCSQEFQKEVSNNRMNIKLESDSPRCWQIILCMHTLRNSYARA